MAGFSHVKRILYDTSSPTLGRGIVFKDEEPFFVGYQKFYDNESFYDFVNELFEDLQKDLPFGTYDFFVSTLGAYGDARIEYSIEYKKVATPVYNTLGVE